ncbi:hypothetical protein ABKN59_010001 [Abortiporus biennis]
MASKSVPPPSHQEIARKLSVHSAARPTRKPTLAPVSGTESDSDSFTPEVIPPSPISAISLSAQMITGSSSQPPLSSIAERRSASGGEESEEDEEDEDGGWNFESEARQRGSLDETVLKTGYLWKKGERRKTWKKRWFVLRPAHLAFYKTSAEYKLLRLLDLSDIHSITPVELKKHANTFGIISPTRTFYLQAESPIDVQEWIKAITEAKTSLLATSTQNSATSPIPIPNANTPSTRRSYQAGPLTASPSHSPQHHHLTSSESEDASPSGPRSYTMTSKPINPQAGEVSSPSKQPGPVKDASKPILSGYLMKCGSRRHIWHNRWFVLSGEKLLYCRSHMDTKPHRQIPLSQILDALEYELPSGHRPDVINPTSLISSPPGGTNTNPTTSTSDEPEVGRSRHTFKVVTTKRTLLLALIARRSGAGVVPGDHPIPSTSTVIPQSTSPPPIIGQGTGSDSQAQTQGGGSGISGVGSTVSSNTGAVVGGGGSSTMGTGTGSSGGHGKRRDSFARRLSLSGGGFIGSSSQSQSSSSPPPVPPSLPITMALPPSTSS